MTAIPVIRKSHRAWGEWSIGLSVEKGYRDGQQPHGRGRK